MWRWFQVRNLYLCSKTVCPQTANKINPSEKTVGTLGKHESQMCSFRKQNYTLVSSPTLKPGPSQKTTEGDESISMENPFTRSRQVTNTLQEVDT